MFLSNKIIDMIDLKQFIEKFAEQFDETDVSVFNADMKFKELEEWSSLMALSIMAMIDEEYDVSLKGDDLKSSTTVEDLYKIVNVRRDV